MSTTGQAGRSVVPTAGGGGDAELARLLLDHIEGQIRSADTKALFVIVACAFLANSLISSRGASRSLFGGTPLQSTMALLTILTFLALVGATAFAVLVIRPRKDAPSRWNLLFFQHISEHDEETFIGHFQSQLPHEVATAVLAQVHAKSWIAKRKYSGITKSVNCLLAALVLWALVIVLSLARPL